MHYNCNVGFVGERPAWHEYHIFLCCIGRGTVVAIFSESEKLQSQTAVTIYLKTNKRYCCSYLHHSI